MSDRTFALAGRERSSTVTSICSCGSTLPITLAPGSGCLVLPATGLRFMDAIVTSGKQEPEWKTERADDDYAVPYSSRVRPSQLQPSCAIWNGSHASVLACVARTMPLQSTTFDSPYGLRLRERTRRRFRQVLVRIRTAESCAERSCGRKMRSESRRPTALTREQLAIRNCYQFSGLYSLTPPSDDKSSSRPRNSTTFKSGSRTNTETWPSRPNDTGPWVMRIAFSRSASIAALIDATRSATCVYPGYFSPTSISIFLPPLSAFAL